MSALRIARVDDGELPITHGRLLDFTDDPIACMRKLRERHGNVAAIEEIGQRMYFIFGPEYNHRVLTDPQTYHSQFFSIRGPKKSPQRHCTSGLLSMNGEQHKRNRRLVMDAFQKKAVSSYLPIIEQETRRITGGWKPGQEVDINREMTDLMLRVTSSILFGLDDPESAYRIGRMVDHWVHMNHDVGMAAYVTDEGLLSRYSQLLEMAGEVMNEVLSIIERRRREGLGQDALSMLLQAHDEEGSISDEELVGQVTLLFAAGHLTMAHTLTWTLFLLAQHPSIMQQVYHEMQTGSGHEHRGDPLETQSALDLVIRESMRVLPASSYSQRITSCPTQLGPFALPKAVCIVFSQFMTHHMPELYPNPELFQPSRWINQTLNPYAYLPFGAGPRMCIGAPLGMVMLKSILPTILREYKVTMVPYSSVGARVISTMLAPTTSVMMTIDRQDGRFEAKPVLGTIHDLVEMPEVATVPIRKAA